MKILLTILLLSPPLSLSWNKGYKSVPKIEGYRYHSGTKENNPIVYIGKSKLINLESEIQIFFARNKITKAILILGPQGLNQDNCTSKFRQYVELMKDKYGPPTAKINQTSILKNEIISSSKCHLFQAGLEKRQIIWEKQKFKIKVILTGDQDGIYIETFYFKKQIKINKNIYKKISKEITK